MNQNLLQAGNKLLNALSNHSNLIMQAYFSGSVTESDHSPKIIQNLIDLKVLWRPSDDGQLRLRPSLRTLLEESLQDEHNRQIDANIGNALARLQTQAEHFKDALAKQDFNAADGYLADLTENVYGLTETLGTNVRLLWSRINNEFGYVASLDAKIRENELAQKQVSEMLEQLELFQFDHLSEIAGSNRQLRQLIVVTLQNSFSHCAKELSLVQAKLIELLGRFRQFVGKTRLLKGFLLHMEQKPDYDPADYANHSYVPDLFNCAAPAIQGAQADVTNAEHESDLFGLVASIRHIKRTRNTRNARLSIDKLSVEEQESVSLQEDKLKDAVEDYFCEVIDSSQRITALSYHRDKELPFDQEAWLYQVIGGFQGLPEQERQYFAMETLDQPHPIYSGNVVIHDVEIGLR